MTSPRAIGPGEGTPAPRDAHPGSVAPDVGPLEPEDATDLGAELLDSSLATDWPKTVTARTVVVAALLLILGLSYLPVVSDDPVAALFIPLLLGAIGVARVVLDLPLRSPAPRRAARATGVVGAALTLALVTAAARTLAGADDVLVASAIVGALSVLVFWGALALSDWERRFFVAARRVLFVGERHQHSELRREIHRHRGMALVGHLSLDESRSPGALRACVAETSPTMLVFSATAAQSPALCDAAVAYSTEGMRVATLSDLYRDHFGRVPLRDLPPSWAIREIADLHRPRTYALVKIVVERLASALVLLLLSPVLALSALAIRLTSPGPVIYRQERVGHRGAPITILKLRTMTAIPEHERAAWASDDLHRVTAVGRLLRRFRIDEAPQLINVVRGSLSLIGPRPEQVAIVARLNEELPFYHARHWVRPGLTGWAQIRFGYGGSLDGARQKLEYDLYYVERQSLLLDLRIALGTVRAIVRGVGT